MTKHAFIFEPGQWIGEGRVRFSSSPDEIKFYTKWNIPDVKTGGTSTDRQTIYCFQQVEMRGTNEQVLNQFCFSEITPLGFLIELENELVGKVRGKGVIEPKTIAWEFRGHSNFEGFEVYELLENGDYMLHAEYSSLDQFRTIIDGRIWKKVSKM